MLCRWEFFSSRLRYFQKLTLAMENGPLEDVCNILKMGIFHCYVYQGVTACYDEIRLGECDVTSHGIFNSEVKQDHPDSRKMTATKCLKDVMVWGGRD